MKYTKLKIIRTKRELTQGQLAEKSGVNLRTIQALESCDRDVNKMTLENAYKLAVALNCSVAYFLDLDRIEMPDGRTAAEFEAERKKAQAASD